MNRSARRAAARKTTRRCEVVLTDMGPHEGCAEFVAPVDHPCDGVATGVVITGGSYPWGDGKRRLDRQLVCQQHQDEAAAAGFAGHDIPGLEVLRVQSLR